MRVIEANRLIQRIMNNEIHMHRNPNIYTSLITEDLIFDAVPVNHSQWIYGEDEYGNDGYYCKECGEHVKWNYNTDDINFIEKYEYCPYCGRKIDRGEDDRKTD